MPTKTKDQNAIRGRKRGLGARGALSQRPRLPPNPLPVLPSPVVLLPPVVFVFVVLLLLLAAALPPTQFQEMPEHVQVVLS